MAVVNYQVRVDGGSPVDAGENLEYTVTGLTSLQSVDIEVRAEDDGGGFSEWTTVAVGTSLAMTNPSALSDVGGYWDALIGTLDGGGAAASDGETVATWEGQLGTNEDFVQGTDANRPVRRISEANDLACLYFNNKEMDIPAWTQWKSLTKQTFVVVFRPVTAQANSIIRPYTSTSGLYINVDSNSDNMDVVDQVTNYASSDQPGVVGLGLQIFSFIWDGTLTGDANRWKMRRNGVPYTQTFTAGSAPANSNSFGDGIKIGYQPGGNADFELFAVLHIKDALDTSTIAAVENYFKARFVTPMHRKRALHCMGDSRTFNYSSSASEAWPHLVALGLGYNSWRLSSGFVTAFDFDLPGIVRNNGINSGMIDASPSLTASQHSNVTIYRDEYRLGDVVLLCVGINDLSLGNETAATLRTKVISYIQALQNVGFTVGIATLCPIAASIIDWEDFEPEWIAYNDGLRTNHSFADFFIDYAADERLAEPLNPLIYTDGTHFTAAGNEILAELTLAALDGIL